MGDTSRGAVVDIDEAMMRVALETVAASLFGTDLSADADRLARATLEALDVVVSSAQVPIRLPAWTPSQRTLRRATRELDEAVHRMVQRRLAELNPVPISSASLSLHSRAMSRSRCARCATNSCPSWWPVTRLPRVR